MAPVGHVKRVVEKTVLFIPHADAIGAEMVHGLGDVEEVLPELAGHVLVGGIFARQFERNPQQVEAVHRHPAGAVGLLDELPAGQWRAAVEHADVVEP